MFFPLKRVFRAAIVCVLIAFSTGYTGQPEIRVSDTMRVLILSGRNNHQWQQTTGLVKRILEQGGHFAVEVTLRPDTLDGGDFSGYDAVLSNWNSWPENDLRWPETAERGLLQYLENGGGLVFFHASTSVFYRWPEFREISTGAWIDETHHGAPSEVRVTITDREHPIARDLTGFIIFDELWIDAEQNPDFRILAYASHENAADGKEDLQPAVFVSEYGKGRIFHTILGHDQRAIRNTGFRTLLLRGVEWASTGEVTGAPPAVLSASHHLEDSYRWQESDTSLALLSGGRIVWKYQFNTLYGKPFFHPVCPERTSFTWLAPEDHPWHLGQWFSWKYINNQNYWEFDRESYRSEGVTSIRHIDLKKASDYSVTIELELEYGSGNEKPIMKENRIIHVHAPGEHRITMDYEMRFTALAEEVFLDRTPIEGEPDGKSWGGYAGLSIRFDHDMTDPHWISSGGEGLDMNGRNDDWLYMGFRDLRGDHAGSAIFIHPGSKREGSGWYLINQPEQPFYYLSPAYLYLDPVTLKEGEELQLRYRVWHHSGTMDMELLINEYSEYIDK